MILLIIMARILAILLCVSLLPAQPDIKEQVLRIPAGSLVEVKLKDKRVFRGRIGLATADSFVVQHAKSDKIVDEKIAFQDVKSVKPKGRGLSTRAKVAIGAAIGAGGLYPVALLLIYLGWGG